MAYMILDIPKSDDIQTNQVSTILASDGSEIAQIIPPEGNRSNVTINQVPIHVRNSVMAAEDRDFYDNPGFSFISLLRSAKNNLFRGSLQGGSTITQQYVKNALVGDERFGMGGLIRKAKELVISTKISNEWSKDNVMQAYLNMIYFGRGSYGIEEASKAYFNKSIEQIDLTEGALIAALIQRPSTLDPLSNLEDAINRWKWVLKRMVEVGSISNEEYIRQKFPFTTLSNNVNQSECNIGPNGIIARQVTKELLELFDVNEQALNTEGLQIITTINPQVQKSAEESIIKYLSIQTYDIKVAIVSINPHDGALKAYYGGSDPNGFDFAQAGLPTGSSFKVFALIAALQQGIGLSYQIDSSPLIVNGVRITNVEGESCGICSIAEALKRSLNTSYYRLMLKLNHGSEDVAKAAHEAGVADSFPGVNYTLSEDKQGGPPNNGIVLGQYQSRVIDMASSYATLANSGTYHKPHFIQKIVTSLGETLFDTSSWDSSEMRINRSIADNATLAMLPIAEWSHKHSLSNGRESASKTGTSQLGSTKDNRDAWMVGYTPSLSTAVWVGTTDGLSPLKTSLGSSIYGSGLPADIWKSTMDNALKKTKNETFSKSIDIGNYIGLPQISMLFNISNLKNPISEFYSTEVIKFAVEIAPGINIFNNSFIIL